MSKRSTAARLFRGLWLAADGTRKVLHLFLLLFVFSVVLGALSVSAPKLPEQAALVIRPVGDLVEQLEGDPFERALNQLLGDPNPQTLVQDVLDGLAFAKDDDRIKAVVLELDNLGGGGLSKLQRIAAAVEDFRGSGKPVIATADAYSQNGYYLAAHADEVYMHPDGVLMLRGYGVYLNYFKEAIDKLRIDWNVFKVGTHKSAVEPFTRNDMSPEDRESMERLTNRFWDLYSTDVERARALDGETLDSLLTNFVSHVRNAGGSTARVAVEFGLVDELLVREQVSTRIGQYAGMDRDDPALYNAAELDDYLEQMRMLRGGPDGERNVAVIVAAGEILNGRQAPGTVGGDSTAEQLRRARLDDTVEAIVLHVDSPGGSAFASEVIRNEIQGIREAGIPVVASMSSVAASGGYWIAMAADRIYASPSTVTGSIGIFGMFPTFQRSLASLGITTDGTGTSLWAGELRPDRAMSEDAKELVQVIIEEGYDDFTRKVARHRGMEQAEVDRVAQGQVWTGEDALAHGLVDALGTLDDAVAAAAGLAELEPDSYGRKYYEEELTPAERLALQLLGGARTVGLDLRAFARRDSSLERVAEAVSAALAPALRFNDPKGIYAHCFCRFE